MFIFGIHLCSLVCFIKPLKNKNETLFCRPVIMVEKFRTEFRGTLLSVIIGVFSFYASRYTAPLINSITLAFIFGIIIGNIVSIPRSFDSGINFTGSKLLEFSILFMAFSINYVHVAELGLNSFLIISVVLLSVLVFSYYASLYLKLPGTTGWLIGFGTAICGSSAIASLSGKITKDKEDVGISMAVVNLLGTAGMLVMPFVLRELPLTINQMGLLLGGTLHSVGNVAGAGYAISQKVGDSALTIKLARVALLSPGLMLFNFLVNRNNVKHWSEHFQLPWYLWGFIILTFATSIISFPHEFLQFMKLCGRITLVISMAAIGLKVNFRQTYQKGKGVILFGVLVFLVQITLVTVLMFLL